VLASSYLFNREANLEALRLTQLANNTDPEFATSYALGAFLYVAKKSFGWSTDVAQERVEAMQLARRAIELDKNDPSVLAMAGHALSNVVGEVEEGMALLARAINLDPNLANARYWIGWALVYLGEGDAAIQQFLAALRLSPLDPRIYNAQTGLAYAHFLAGRDEDALSWATTSLRQQPNFVASHRVMMACQAMSGRIAEATQTCVLALQLDPTQRISKITVRAPFRRPEDINKLAHAFRIAGMPE
jgi:tetratricopeptide (TPR) repeat protein